LQKQKQGRDGLEKGGGRRKGPANARLPNITLVQAEKTGKIRGGNRLMKPEQIPLGEGGVGREL